mgnify:CR=1 FL=1
MSTLLTPCTFWIHNKSDKAWNSASYVRLYDIESENTLWKFHNSIISSQNIFAENMIFFMKRGILPKWEDTNNINGGCWSFKYGIKEHINFSNIFTCICSLLINKNIIKSNNTCDINGVSFVKKKKHFIVKVWTSTVDSIQFSEEFSKIIIITSGIFQKHQKNIKRDFRKKTIYNYRKS